MATSQTAHPRVEDTLSRVLGAMNRHDAQALAAAYAPEATVFDPQYPELLRGTDAVARDFEEFFAAFPDFKMELTQTLAQGDVYAIEYEFSGTHEGPLTGPAGHIPATHRRVRVRGGAFARLDPEGRIVEEKRYYDLAGLLGQLGLMQ